MQRNKGRENELHRVLIAYRERCAAIFATSASAPERVALYQEAREHAIDAIYTAMYGHKRRTLIEEAPRDR